MTEPEQNQPLDILSLASLPPLTPNQSSRFGFRTIRTTKERRLHRPEINRRLDEIPAGLRRVIGKLLSGLAPWPLLLHGPSGVGKSCAALAITDIVESSSFWEAEKLQTFVLNREFHEVENEFLHIAKYELAVLDELGTRDRAGELAYSSVMRFIDAREAKNRSAVYVSNISPEGLRAIYDNRVFSRLTCGTVIEFAGHDRRAEATDA